MRARDDLAGALLAVIIAIAATMTLAAFRRPPTARRRRSGLRSRTTPAAEHDD